MAKLGMPFGDKDEFATLEYTNSGILVRYREAVKKRRRVPSPLMGLDMGYVKFLFEMIAQQMGGDDWDEAKKEARLERVRKAMQEAKMPTEDRYEEIWALEDKAVFCPRLDDIPSAIKVAYDAHTGVMELRRDGHEFGFGPPIAYGIA